MDPLDFQSSKWLFKLFVALSILSYLNLCFFKHEIKFINMSLKHGGSRKEKFNSNISKSQHY